MGEMKKPLIIILTLVLISVFAVQALATDEAVTNGGFESGTTRWNTVTDGFGTYDDWSLNSDGAYTGSLGVDIPEGGALGCLIVQNLTHPILVSDLINFTVWVKGGVGDGTFWAGLVFNSTGWIDNLVVLGAGGSATWTQLYRTDFSAYAGEQITAITVTGYGGESADETVQFDVVSLEVAEGAGGEWIDFTQPGVYDELIADLVGFVVPIVIVLLPAILLITITRSTDKWILLIGITIGAGLGYFFNLVPVWVVFLVVIGLIGMAYQSVRGGG